MIKSSRTNLWVCGLGILVTLLLAALLGCATPQPAPTPDIPATVTAQVQAHLDESLTATAYPTHTPYPTVTAYPTPTKSPTATPYPTATPRPTYTPYPTATPTPAPTATPTPTPLAYRHAYFNTNPDTYSLAHAYPDARRVVANRVLVQRRPI